MKNALLPIIFILFSACNEKNDFKKQLLELESKVRVLEISEENSRRMLEQIDGDFFNYKIMNDHSYAAFNPDSTGYSRIDTESASFLVSLEKIIPYADGHRATFNVGNTSFTDYKNVKMKVRFGIRFDSKKMKYSDWEKTLRTAEATRLGDTAKGSWNLFVVTLSPSSATEIGYIETKFETNIVSLRVSH